ncbi:metalloprotease [Cristinia sonorae]|uniref:Metalloprotease n=1 Tax=Cristinia sonorae TaxID=1940300 RepID=A0A8K0XLW5_9AGAR|nr:metalloprotease [Cristinia sonorae]
MLTPSAQRCGTRISAQRKLIFESDFEANAIEPEQTFGTESLLDAVIPVHWHVIAAETKKPEHGNIPDSQIKAQIDVLNKDYSKTGLKFKLASVSRTFNTTWFLRFSAYDDDLEHRVKKTLHKGGPAALNLYSTGFQDGDSAGLLGYAYFPAEYRESQYLDGVVIHFASVPGGALAPYNEGKTATHEVGHWVGLYHTFEGYACSGPGDYVSDTPYEIDAAFGCPVGLNTCPGKGDDPIHNYMDYTDDGCMNQFTKGQIKRLKRQILYYRGILTLPWW